MIRKTYRKDFDKVSSESIIPTIIEMIYHDEINESVDEVDLAATGFQETRVVLTSER